MLTLIYSAGKAAVRLFLEYTGKRLRALPLAGASLQFALRICARYRIHPAGIHAAQAIIEFDAARPVTAKESEKRAPLNSVFKRASKLQNKYALEHAKPKTVLPTAFSFKTYQTTIMHSKRHCLHRRGLVIAKFINAPRFAAITTGGNPWENEGRSLSETGQAQPQTASILIEANN